MSDVRKIK